MATYKLTYNDIYNEINARCGNRQDADIATRLKNIINEAYLQILYDKRFLFHELEKRATLATVAGTQEYAKADDCLLILGLWDTTNKRKLEKETFDEWQTNNRTTTQGFPTMYARSSAALFLRPPPKGAYTLLKWFIKTTARLENAGDIPVLPEDWHDGIIIRGSEIGRMAFREPDLAYIEGRPSEYQQWLAGKLTAKDYEMINTDIGMKLKIW